MRKSLSDEGDIREGGMTVARFVIIGGGAAGIGAAEELRRLDGSAEIVLISEDDKIHSRCMLHKYLSGERSEEGINFISQTFFEQNKIEWIKEQEAVQVYELDRVVELDGGGRVSYDKLLVASGSEYFIPPIPNFRDAANVYGFRNMSDARKILSKIESGPKTAVIIGGGLVGLDVAYGLCHRGIDVTVVEMADRVMPLQTDAYAASVYQKAFEKAGCHFRIGVSVKNSRISKDGSVESVVLSDESEIPCDFVVVATSVRPKLGFLRNTSLQAAQMNYHISTVLNKFYKKTDFHVSKGLEVNEYMQTSSPDIFGAGDVTGISSIWPDARAMGKIAAKNMCGRRIPYRDAFPNKNTSNFFGIDMLSLGRLDVDAQTHQVLVHRDRKAYKKAVIQDDKLIGILIQGDISNSGIYLHLIRNKISLGQFEKNVFQLSYADFYHINQETGEFLYEVI